MKKFKYGEYVEFKDQGWSAFVRGLDQIDKKAVKIGFLHSSPEHKPEGKVKAVNIMQLAAIHEFGAPKSHVPPRPFIRPTADAKRTHFLAEQKRYLQMIVRGLAANGKILNLDLVLAHMGEEMAGFIKKTIVDMTSPPNALSTQRAKGRKLITGKFNRRLGGWRVKGMKGRQSVAPLVDNPLEDTGQMKNSVRWAITTDLQGGI